MKEILLLIELALTIMGIVHGQQEVIVNITQGTLQGKKVASVLTGGQYYSFQGIPYAQPPVGDLRFQAPTEAPKWTGVRDATFERSMCLQPNGTETNGSEDCLYLNVYTSQLPSTSARTLLPVMVWIHGGEFTTGSSTVNKFHPDYLVEKGVVFVAMNYRLGVLGFLGLNNSRISANNGLKDQMAALKWVQANIEPFGGDKDQVTIFGCSAGGTSVELQIISPITKGLIHRAISESGNAVIRWSYVEPSLAKIRAFLLGQQLGFTSDNEDALVDFLKKVPGRTLIAAQNSAVTREDQLRNNIVPFQPTKESVADAFLPDSPLNIMKSGKYQDIPYITGFNSAEGKLFEIDYLHNNTLWAELANDMEQFVPLELNLPLGSPESLRLSNEIRQLYFGNDTLTVKNIEALVNVFSDSYFICGVRRAANFRLRNISAPVYVYQFSYVGDLSSSEIMHFGYPFRDIQLSTYHISIQNEQPTSFADNIDISNTLNCKAGASHGDEQDYLFNTNSVQVENNSTDMLVLNRMTTMWTNFAKTGNPTVGMEIQWDSLTLTKKTYLNIDYELSAQNLNDFKADKFAFWDRILAGVDN